MGRESKQPEEEGSGGAPEWMVTFSDCMTLLLTFFVLLLSFSSFDEKLFKKLKIIFSEALPSVSASAERDKGSFVTIQQIQEAIGPGEGSEKPTLTRRGEEDNLKEESEPVDFHRRKVFLVPSKKIFWGKGTVISSDGRSTLAAMAAFIKEVGGRVVISENGPEGDKGDENFGLPRAWSVMDYLTTEQGLAKGQFSITSASTIAAESPKSSQASQRKQEAEHMLEIVLLERSIYD